MVIGTLNQSILKITNQNIESFRYCNSFHLDSSKIQLKGQRLTYNIWDCGEYKIIRVNVV